jgi:hypothetical protein
MIKRICFIVVNLLVRQRRRKNVLVIAESFAGTPKQKNSEIPFQNSRVLSSKALVQ